MDEKVDGAAMNAKELRDWFTGPGRIIPIPISGMDAEDKQIILRALSLLAATEANDRTTPETDAEVFDAIRIAVGRTIDLSVVNADFARRLERERNRLAAEREVQNKWIGCGECDTCFDCHEGKTRCIRLDKKEKRKVELWYHESWADAKPPYAQYAGQSELINGVDGWRKVGVAEIDA